MSELGLITMLETWTLEVNKSDLHKKNEIKIDDLSRNCFIEAYLKTKGGYFDWEDFVICVQNFQNLAALNIRYV